jgi:hypothetical protein
VELELQPFSVFLELDLEVLHKKVKELFNLGSYLGITATY